MLPKGREITDFELWYSDQTPGV